MLSAFQTFIAQAPLFAAQDKILIAVSGGIDSVVLCHLCSMAGSNFGIAHCNFQLRGKDSDEDEQFVQQLANQLQVPFYSTTFPTVQIAEQEKDSIQIVARQLRYDWLEEIRMQHNYQYIATAHHLNDSIETAIYNFAKGTGIRGLTGIPVKNNRIIRPLHFATKAQIEAFAQKHDIAYRVDVSNASDKYNRNKIRHHVVPTLQGINPNLEQTAQMTFQHLQATVDILDWAIGQVKKQAVKETNSEVKIELAVFKPLPSPTTFLYEILKSYDFNASQVTQIWDSQETGKQFFSNNYQLLIDRQYLTIQPIHQKQTTIYWIETSINRVSTKDTLFTLQKIQVPETFSTNPNWAYLDYEKLQFPLKLRHWKLGDRFQPLGMGGKTQKLQDFFSNRKLSRFDKEKVWILESNGEICWVVGHRVDERFKITSSTNQCLTIHAQLIQPETDTTP